jgi:hypothetical protein
MTELPIDPPPSLTVEIPISDIYIAEGRKVRFDPKVEENDHFLKNIQTTGVIEPIGVRPGKDGKFEVIFGRKRLWAAKMLGHQTIVARIGYWRDDEVEFLSLVENYFRKQMNPAQKAQATKRLYKHYEIIFGKDPGRKIGGWVGAAAVTRDSKTKQFIKKDVTEEKPANEPGSFAGGEDESSSTFDQTVDNGEAPKAFSERLAEATGQTVRAAQKTSAISKRLTDDQLGALGAHRFKDGSAITQKQLTAIAKIKDPHRRGIAVNLIVGANMHVDEAIERAGSDDPTTQQAIEYRKEQAMPDDQWVKIYCEGTRKRIQEPSTFDGDAILYRHTLPVRTELRRKHRQEIAKAHQRQNTPFTRLYMAAIYVSHPNNWFICNRCLGVNGEDPNCQECGGCGYRLKIEYPERGKH